MKKPQNKIKAIALKILDCNLGKFDIGGKVLNLAQIFIEINACSERVIVIQKF
jgi:hypothetical protein